MEYIDLETDDISGHAALYYIPKSRGEPHYEDSVSRNILDFHSNPRLDWANLYARLLRSAVPIGTDTFTFTPYPPGEDWSAGRSLADALSRITGIPCQELVFLKTPDRKGPVTCTKKHDDRKVVVVDDIWRTGGTMSRCARAVKAAGATKVTALTLAKVATRREQRQDDRKEDEAVLRDLKQKSATETKAQFVKLVSNLPSVGEAHEQPISQQLWRVAAAVNAYAKWCMENIDPSHYHGDTRFGEEDDFQGFADDLMEILRNGPMADIPETSDSEFAPHPILEIVEENSDDQHNEQTN